MVCIIGLYKNNLPLKQNTRIPNIILKYFNLLHSHIKFFVHVIFWVRPKTYICFLWLYVLSRGGGERCRRDMRIIIPSQSPQLVVVILRDLMHPVRINHTLFILLREVSFLFMHVTYSHIISSH